MESRRRRRCAGSAVLAIISLAGVSNGDTCTSPSGFTIESQAAADALKNCSTITGNVNIQSNTLTQLTLNGIEIMEGNLAISSCNGLQKILAPALSQITKNFTLSSLPLLTSLEFPLLDNINGGIYWDTLPDLTDVSFGNLTASPHDLPGTNVDGDISILSTALSSLAFLNFTHFSNPDLIWIKGNQQLNNINLTGLSWGSNSLMIVDNGPWAQIFLPSLKTAGAITIGNVGHIDIPSLSETSGSIEISNNSIDVFTASTITAIGGNFIVHNNYLLEDLSLSLLTSIDGNLVVANNNVRDTATDLNQLWYSHGNITLSGNFSNVTLPNLRSVTNGFHLNSSNPALDCTAFDKLAAQDSWTSSFYSCGAYLPGTMKDMAKHYRAPDKGLNLSRPVKAIIVIISVIAGLFLCALLMRWYSSKTTRPGTQAETPALGLEEIGVTRQEEDEGLPKYRRIGEPGEVPPRYMESENTGAYQVEPRNANPARQTAGFTRAGRLWRLW